MSSTIQVTCPHCQQQCSAPANVAGRRLRCPKCKEAILIQPNPPPGQVVAPAADWLVGNLEGQTFGPVTRSQLDAWVNEGRIDGRWQVLPPGSRTWVQASSIYQVWPGHAPQSAAAAPADDPVAVLARSNPTSTTSDSSTLHHPGIQRALLGTRPWVRLIGIIAFLSTGLSILGAIGLIMVAASIPTGNGTGVVLAMVLVYLVLGGVTGVIGRFLWGYAAAIDRFVKQHSLRALQDALEAQQAYWTIMGVITLIYIGTVAIVAAVGVIGGLAR